MKSFFPIYLISVIFSYMKFSSFVILIVQIVKSFEIHVCPSWQQLVNTNHREEIQPTTDSSFTVKSNASCCHSHYFTSPVHTYLPRPSKQAYSFVIIITKVAIKLYEVSRVCTWSGRAQIIISSQVSQKNTVVSFRVHTFFLTCLHLGASCY